ncbi:MAG: pentapeptide repeat-containing protein [Planctomycetaceae bacterium]|nr:pentapeptide repeat-containing protein [Planctomycetaceae bacterium]
MNPSDELNNEMLTAYFDGELSQAEQLQVEQALFDNPKLRQQLHDWATLRDAISRCANLPDANLPDANLPDANFRDANLEDLMRSEDDSRVNLGVSSAGSAMGSNAASPDLDRLEKAIMGRIAAAVAAGQVGWVAAPNQSQLQSHRVDQKHSPVAGEDGSGVASDASETSAARTRAAEVKDISGPLTTRSTVNAREATDSSTGSWLSDYRRLSPAQRLSRWRWQLGATLAVAAGLLLTVFFAQKPFERNMAYKSSSESSSTPGRPGDFGGPDLMAAEAAPATDEMNGSENPMLQNLSPDSAMVELGSGGGNPVAMMDEVTNFISYDVADSELGLQQMQAVLAWNQMTPVEVFEQDDSSVVVLSGEVKKLVEVLEAFEASGNNSLALLAKVGSDTDSALAANMFQSYGGAPLEVNALNSNAASQLPPSIESEAHVAGVSESHQGQDDLSGQNQDSNLASDIGLLPQSAGQSGEQTAGGLNAAGQNPAGQIAAGQIASGQGQQMAPFGNFRQEIIRSQAIALGNSMAPPPNVTLEEFLNQPPPPKSQRKPFGGQFNAQSQIANLEPTPPNQGVAMAPPANDTANMKLPDNTTARTERLANRQRAQVESPGGGGGQAPGLTQAESTPPSQATADSMVQAPSVAAPRPATEGNANPSVTNPPTTQIVVILRPKSRGQQQSSLNNENQ